MKTYVIWLTKGRKLYTEDTSFTSVMNKITDVKADFHFSEREISRIYCVEDDISLVFFNNVSMGVKKNG